MFDPSVAALFPLPLTVFEKYMFWDDRPDHPMVFACRMRLSGEIARPAFESSLEEAVGRHPLLCALIGRSARKGLVWTLAERLCPTIDWGARGVELRTPRGEHIDLRGEVGLRVWVRQGDGLAEVVLQFHHACCDGAGAMRFLGDLLAAYGLRTAPSDRRPSLQACDPETLLRRGEFTLSGSAGQGRAHTAWANVVDTARMLMRRPATLSGGESPSEPGAKAMPFPGICAHSLDHAESTRLREAAVRQGVALNDLLLRDLFQTVRDWNAAQSPESPPGWLRIAIPIRLPCAGDAHMPAANRTTFTFVTRRGDRCADSDELLRGIYRETDALTRSRRGLQFLRAMHLVECIPGAMPLMRRVKRRMATVVLSNLGEMSRRLRSRFPYESGKAIAGNLVLEELVGAPPVRPATHAALLSGTYAGRLRIYARCDPLVFTAEAAQRFLAAYVDRLKRTIQLMERPACRPVPSDATTCEGT